MAKKYCKIKRKQRLVEREHTYGEKVYDWCNDRKCKFTAYDESDAGNYMKAHKYWSVGALITMIGTFYTGHKGLKSSHKYFALSSMLCMTMAIYTGHKMISGNRKKKANKEKVTEREE